MPEDTPMPNPISDPEAWVAYRNSQLAPVVMSLRDILNQVVDALHEPVSTTDHPLQEYTMAGMLSFVGQKIRWLHQMFHDEASRMDQADAMRMGMQRGAEALSTLSKMADGITVLDIPDIAKEAEKWLRENGGGKEEGSGDPGVS